MRFSISSPDPPQPIVDSIRSLVENQFGEADQVGLPNEAHAEPDVSQSFGVSRGIAIGRPVLLDTIAAPVPTYTVVSGLETKREVEILRTAVAAAITEFDSRIDRLRASLPRQDLEIFDAQRMIFADPTILKEVQAKIEDQHLNAAAAWHEILSRYAVD